jgi:hypothetical protein
VNDMPTRVLDPRSAHPAQYVHTPAAFPVMTSTDASLMGGGYFVDNGNGTFTSAATSPYGFSWLDLYLMGLARADEVPPSFYIDSAQPPLGLEYWPPSHVSVSGNRRDFRVDDVIDAMGPRDPSCPLAQRTFTVYFVLLAGDAGGVARRVDVMRRIRSAFETNFTTATGGRGAVVTTFTPPTPRHRAAAK